MSDPVELFYEEHGKDEGRPALLLIAGQAAQLTDWFPEFIEQLVDAGYYVVTFDNRDAGLSPHMDEAGMPNLLSVSIGEAAPPYVIDDMADDVALLIETVGLQSPVLLTHSLGSMVAQSLAIHYPELISGMVLIATSTGARTVGQPRPEIAAELAGMAPSASAAMEDPLEAAFASSQRWASWQLGMTKDRLRERLRKRLERSQDRVGAARQIAAVLGSPDRTVALRSVKIPTVVIHGADDPLIDVSGGRAVAAAIPDAELIVIDQLRHDMPKQIWPTMIDAVNRVRERSS